MKMIKSRLFLAFLAFSFGYNLQSMEPEKTFPFADLPPEMQYYVVALMSVSSTAKSLQEATDTISALAVTNENLNELLNDPTICLKIIKNLAKQFGCSDQEAAEALGTQEAKRRLDIQQQFFDLCDQDVELFTQADFDDLYELYKKYVDFNFTYYVVFHHEGFNPEKIETTLLMLAIRAENCSLIKILLTLGANSNLANADGYTPLMVAVDTNNKDIVQCLLENSEPHIDLQDSEGKTALMFAVIKNNCSIIKKLLERGADINKTDNSGMTALMIAVGHGHTEAVQCLLQNPYIEINKKDKTGLVAFMYVVGAKQNSCPILQIFLRHGVDINQVDDEGITVLMLAIMVNKMDLFECLVYNRKIAIDQADKKGITPLMWAVRYNNCPMIKILLERGADVNKGDLGGITALMLAAYDGHIETVQCLFDNSTNIAINQRTEEGLTALMFAARGKAHNDYIIKMLLNHGADIDQQDAKGWTALMIAMSMKNKPIIKFLLDAGANPELGTYDGLTPLQLAEQTGDQDIIDLVVDAIKKWGLKKSM